MAIKNKEILQAFNAWIVSDNVALYKGKFITQCAQWKNPQTAQELEAYFLKEYYNDYKNMTVYETLTPSQQQDIDTAINYINIGVLKALKYGESIDITENVSVRHYSDIEHVVIDHIEEDDEILCVQWNENDSEIIYHEL